MATNKDADDFATSSIALSVAFNRPVLAGSEILVFTDPPVPLLAVADSGGNTYTYDPKNKRWAARVVAPGRVVVTGTLASLDGVVQLKAQEWNDE